MDGIIFLSLSRLVLSHDDVIRFEKIHRLGVDVEASRAFGRACNNPSTFAFRTTNGFQMRGFKITILSHCPLQRNKAHKYIIKRES
jgi:hypothetical protein